MSMEASESKPETNLFSPVTSRVFESIQKICAIGDGISLSRLCELAQAPEEDVKAAIKSLMDNNLVGSRNHGEKLRYFIIEKESKAPPITIYKASCGKEMETPGKVSQHEYRCNRCKAIRGVDDFRDPPAEVQGSSEQWPIIYGLTIKSLGELLVERGELDESIRWLLDHGAKEITVREVGK
jgi:hypothetical protein